MNDKDSGLPRYPKVSLEAARDAARPREDTPDSFRDWFRHTWPHIAIFGSLAVLWVLGLVAAGLSNNPQAALGAYFLGTAGLIAAGMRLGSFGQAFWRGSSE